MNNFSRRLDIDKLEIVSPCSVGWDTMSGDEKVRHCESCNKSVFNLINMSRTEIETVLLEQMRDGHGACVRMYKRPDGTLVTADCFSVRDKLRRSMMKSRLKVESAVAVICAALGFSMTNSSALAQDSFGSVATPYAAADSSDTSTATESAVQNAPLLTSGGVAQTIGPRDSTYGETSGEYFGIIWFALSSFFLGLFSLGTVVVAGDWGALSVQRRGKKSDR